MVKTKHIFPETFFNEEDRLGFHIDRQRKELWAIELDMLYELDRVCKKLGISYFLEAGTLLGAARDGHFIPWDDDIDVSMLRKEYDRFLKEAPEEFHEPYFLQTGYTEKDYFRGHSQLRRSDTCAILPGELGQVSFNQGIFLDIFVLDELFPEKLESQYRERKELFRKKRLWSRHDYHPNPLHYAVRWIHFLLYRARFPDSSSFYKRWEKVFRASKKSLWVDSLMFFDSAALAHPFEHTWVDETVDLSFEDGRFPAPKGYREYLAMYYGKDWEMPRSAPSIHGAEGQVILDLNRPYTEVIQERTCS